jgi:hypothetical protein
VDLFLSLAPDTPGPLAGIHHSLWHGLQPVHQPVIRNVSVRIFRRPLRRPGSRPPPVRFHDSHSLAIAL